MLYYNLNDLSFPNKIIEWNTEILIIDKDENYKSENLEFTLNSTDFNIPDDYLDIPPVKMLKKKPLNNERRFILGKCNPVIFVPGFMGPA